MGSPEDPKAARWRCPTGSACPPLLYCPTAQPATSFHGMDSMSPSFTARFTTDWTESPSSSFSSPTAASPSTCTYRMAGYHHRGGRTEG